jgi:hypothetical protein
MDTISYQGTQNTTFTTSATSAQCLPARSGNLRRTQLIITSLTAGVTTTLAKGSVPAIANSGIILTQNGVWSEATDGGYICWQGEVQVVASAPGSISIVESFQSVNDN